MFKKLMQEMEFENISFSAVLNIELDNELSA